MDIDTPICHRETYSSNFGPSARPFPAYSWYGRSIILPHVRPWKSEIYHLEKSNRLTEPYYIHVSVHDDSHLRLDIAPHTRSSVGTMLGNINSTATISQLVFSKRIHLYTHATKDGMKSLWKDSGILTDDLEKSIEKVCGASELCAKIRRPKSSIKILLTHVNTDCNQKIQIDYYFSSCAVKSYVSSSSPTPTPAPYKPHRPPPRIYPCPVSSGYSKRSRFGTTVPQPNLGRLRIQSISTASKYFKSRYRVQSTPCMTSQ